MKFEGGAEIAIMVPWDRYDATLHFYRDILLMDVEEYSAVNPLIAKAHLIQFGLMTLCLCCMEDIDEPVLWLELKTTDLNAASRFLKSNDISTGEPFKEASEYSQWIRDPAGNMILMKEMKP